MFVVVLVLLVLAAVFGVLGEVLEAVAFLVITAVLTAVVLGTLAWWALKRKVRQFQADIDSQLTEQRVTRYRVNEAERDPAHLPRTRDDRY
jgi:arginine exporter protein ArgO